MQILINGQIEEWNIDKVNSKLPKAIESNIEDGKKDFDEAWMTQWASGEGVHKLQLIKEIIEDPYLTLEYPICPKCGRHMIMRNSPRQWQRGFWGCSWFPSCRGTMTWKQQETAPKMKVQLKKQLSMAQSSMSYSIGAEIYGHGLHTNDMPLVIV